MINYLKSSGWIAAFILLILFLSERSCSRKFVLHPQLMTDTIINGDRQLQIVEDTVIKPVTVFKADTIYDIDTDAVIHNYFATRVYSDTVKARDITAVIRDSISGDSIEGRKVWLENSRDLEITNSVSIQRNQFLAGGYLGYSQFQREPEAGISLDYLSKHGIMLSYRFDFFSRSQSIGIAWRILPRKL